MVTPVLTNTVLIPPSIPTESRDVTADLLSFFEQIPDGYTIVGPGARGRYRCDDILRVEGRRLGFEDVRVFRLGPYGAPEERSFRPHWYFLDCPAVTLRRLWVENTNTVTWDPVWHPGWGSYFGNKEFEHGIRIIGSSSAVVEDSYIDGIYGDGLYFANSSNVVARRVNVNRNGRQGATVINSDNVLLDQLTIPHSPHAAVDLEHNNPNYSEVVSRVEIMRCTFGSHLITLACGGPGRYNDVDYHHNVATVGAGTPLWRGRSKEPGAPHSRGWRVRDSWWNYPLEGPIAGFQFYQTDDILLERVHTTFASDQPGVTLSDCGGPIRIFDNEFLGATGVYTALDPATAAVVEERGNALR